MNTPLLILVFNRPEATKKLIDEIKAFQPTQIFIASDGPRKDNDNDLKKCREVKDIISSINWPCELKTLYRDENLGGPKAISEAVSWFFSHVEEGIILEDDCMPHPDFFQFCSELLEKYRENKNIMSIGGFNYGVGITDSEDSYYYSSFCVSWGWASWRRAWGKFDWKYMASDYQDILPVCSVYTKNQEAKKFFARLLQTYHWDAQWLHSIWRNEGICILPHVSLIKNIGFGKDATHTIEEKDPMAEVCLFENKLKFPLNSPKLLQINSALDEEIYNKAFSIRNESFIKFAFNRSKKWILNILYIFKLKSVKN